MKDVPDTPIAGVPDRYRRIEMRRARQPVWAQQNRYFPDVLASAGERIPPGCESGTVRLTLVEPLVVEVSADVAWSGQAFRHLVRLTRVRPELSPAEVSLPVGFK